MLRVEKKTLNEKQLLELVQDGENIGWLLGREGGLLGSPGVKNAVVYSIEPTEAWNNIAPDFSRACSGLKKKKRFLVEVEVPQDFTLEQCTGISDEIDAVVSKNATLK